MYESIHRLVLKFFFLFSMLCIPLGLVREVKISVIGFLKKDDILRSKLFTKLYFPMLTLRFFSLEEHLKDKGFYEGGFLHLDNIFRKSSHSG
jgi:hypothetical protein